MIAYFSRVKPRLSESDEISYIHRNLLSTLKIVIPRHNLFSIVQFQEIKILIEKSYSVGKSYKSPLPPEK